jgi:hypothetical protein
LVLKPRFKRWVEEATDVAKSAAEKSGWDYVPWEELQQKVIEVTGRACSQPKRFSG